MATHKVVGKTVHKLPPLTQTEKDPPGRGRWARRE
jgi:hypothetical protein